MGQELSFSEQLLFTTVRIECELETGERSVGTGFFFQFKEDKLNIPTIITNKHVVKKARRGIFYLTLANPDNSPKIGSFESITMDSFEQFWVPHPDGDTDLCTMPIAPLLNRAKEIDIKFFYRAFDQSVIAKPKILNDLTALEEILMVGYPVGIWDSSNNMPIFRSGITATHPNIDYNGKKEFLIDCACFPGSSGSPVLLYNFGSYTDRKGNTFIGTRIALLGVLYAGPQFTVEGEMQVVPIPTNKKDIPISNIPTNLGVVIKASKILEFEPVLFEMAHST